MAPSKIEKTVKIQVILIQVGVVIFFPIILPILILGWVWRWGILKWGKSKGEFLHPVPHTDFLFVTDTPHAPHSAIAYVHILKGNPSKERIVSDLKWTYDLRDENGKRIYWKLGTYPKEWRGYWVYKEVKGFHIENQVTILKDWKLTTPQDVNRFMEHVLRHRFLPSTPWWDVTIAPNYLDGPGSLAIIRFSHGYADGYSLVKFCFRLSGFKNLPASIPMDTTPPPVSTLSSSFAFVKQVMTEGLTIYIRLYNSLPQTNIFRNGPLLVGGIPEEVTGRWNCALTPTFPLEKVKLARRAFSTSFYAIIISAVLGGLRGFSEGQGWDDNLLPGIVTTLLALSMPRHPACDDRNAMCNHWRPTVMDLPFNKLDTVSTLATIHSLLEKWKVSTAPEFGTLVMRLMSLFPVSSRFDDLIGFEGMTLISSIASSADKIPPLFGEEVEDMFHFMPINRENVASLAWGCWSANGHLRISITAEQIFFPRREHAQHIANCIYDELNKIYDLAVEKSAAEHK